MYKNEKCFEDEVVINIDLLIETVKSKFNYNGDVKYFDRQVKIEGGVIDILLIGKRPIEMPDSSIEYIASIFVVELKNKIANTNILGQVCRYMNYFKEVIYFDDMLNNIEKPFFDYESFGVLLSPEYDNDMKHIYHSGVFDNKVLFLNYFDKINFYEENFEDRSFYTCSSQVNEHLLNSLKEYTEN